MEAILRILNDTLAQPVSRRHINPANLALMLIWLIHIVAMGGVALGFEEWFISKTPLTLAILSAVLIVFYPLHDLRKFTVFVMIALIAFYSEWLGVQFGLIFGEYSYGSNLGWKIEGVPFLISLNWGLLVLITATLSTRISNNLLIRILIGASMMVFLDLFMEPLAPRFDFWSFSGGTAPLSNYLGWFGVALLLQLITQKAKLIGDFRICFHLYIVQLTFFAWFNVFFSL